MALRDEFRSAIEITKIGKAGQPRLSRLHHAIIGPARSGKTTQAHEFAALLKQEKITSGETVQIHFGSVQTEAEAVQIMQQAKNGVLIVDEMRKTSQQSSGQAALLTYIRAATVDGRCVVLLTGDKQEVNGILFDNQPLRDSIHVIETERSFTRSEIEEYLHLKEEFEHRWDPDVALKKPVTAMKVLRLNKWEPT